VSGLCRGIICAFFAFPVKYRFEHVDFKIVFIQDMPLNRIQKIAVQMDQASADLTFQMKMIPAGFPGINVLIAGAFAFTQDILMNLPFFRQPFKVAVYGRLPYVHPLGFKIPQDLAGRHMGIPQGRHVVKD
jgi:hypothetical protein